MPRRASPPRSETSSVSGLASTVPTCKTRGRRSSFGARRKRGGVGKINGLLGSRGPRAGYSSVSDYARDLIREEQIREAEGRLAELVREGLESGAAKPIDSGYWRTKHAALGAFGRARRSRYLDLIQVWHAARDIATRDRNRKHTIEVALPTTPHRSRAPPPSSSGPWIRRRPCSRSCPADTGTP